MTVTNERLVELLEASADALLDGWDPLHQHFLIEQEVTADECFALSNALAAGATVLAEMLKNPAMARGAIAGANTALAYQAVNVGLSKLKL